MKKLLSYVAAVAATLFSLGAHAYVITVVGPNGFGVPSPGGTGTFSCVGAVAPDCDVDKTFTAVGAIPIIIGGDGVGIVHIAETVINNTGVTWTDFHIQYAPIDAHFATFVTFSNFTNADWAMLSTGPNFLTLFGSSIASGDGFELAFDLTIASPLGAFNLFALNESPSVAPAPGTLALFGLALAGLGAVSRRKRA